MTTTTFGIGGMHCASCVSRNERAIAKLPRVSPVNLNLSSNNAGVEYDEGAFSKKPIQAAVIKTGSPFLATADTRANTARELQKVRLRAFAAIALTIPVVAL